MKNINIIGMAIIFAAFIAVLVIANNPVSIITAHHFAENAVISICRVSAHNPDAGDSLTISANARNIRANDGNDRARFWVTFEAYDQQSRLIKKISTARKTIHVDRSYTFRKTVIAGGSFLPEGVTTAIICGLHRSRQHISMSDIDEDHADAGNVRVKERNFSPVITSFSPREKRIEFTPGDSVRETFVVSGQDQNRNLDQLVWTLTSEPDHSNTPQERKKKWTNGSLYFEETETFTIHRKAKTKYTLTARIFDKEGASDIVTWRIIVGEDDPDNPPELGRIEPPGIHKTLMVNQRQTFLIVARDEDEDLDLDATTFASKGGGSGSCSTVGDSGNFQAGCEFSFSDAGDYRVEASVEDEAGNEKSIYWNVTVEDPPVACTASRVSPTNHDLDLEEGGHLAFKVKIDCEADRWDLIWRKNGSILRNCGHNQSCYHIFGAPGRFRIDATFHGRRTQTIVWYITVTEDQVVPPPLNHPPKIFRKSPDNPVSLNIGDSQTFTASATDQDGDILSSNWEMDGDSVSREGDSYTHVFSSAGNNRLSVTFMDPQGASVSAYWQITVERVVVPPTNRPPQVTEQSPGSPVNLRTGDSQTFSAAATDPEGDTISSRWEVNGAIKSNTGYSYTTNFRHAGRNTVVAIFTDAHGASARVNWIVQVINEPTPPPPTCEATRVAPAAQDVALLAGDYGTFIVSITCDGWDLSWYQDDVLLKNCRDNTSCGNTFRELGRSQIKASFTKDDSTTKTITWTISVRERPRVVPPPPPPEYPPDLEIDGITIDGDESPDRFSVGQEVRIRVSIFNDGDGNADSSAVCIFISQSRRVNSSSAKPTKKRSIKSISSDDSEGVSFRHTLSEADVGERYLIAHADCDDELDEDSESNNDDFIGPFMVEETTTGNCTEKTNALIALDSSPRGWADIIRFNIPAEYMQEVREDFEELKRGFESKSSSYEIRHSIEDGNELILIWAGHGREERFVLCANLNGAAFSYLAPAHAIPSECKEATFDFVADQFLGIIYLINMMLRDAEDRNQIMEFLIHLSSITAPSYIVAGMEEPYDLMINGGDLEELKRSYSQRLNDDFTFVGDLVEGIVVSIVEPITTSLKNGDHFYATCRGIAEGADLILLFTPTPLGKSKVATTVTKAALIENGAKISSKGGTGIRCVALGCIRTRLQNKGFTQTRAEEIIDAIAESGREYDTVVKLIETSDRRIIEHIQDLGTDDAIVKEFLSGRLSGEGAFSHIAIWREFKNGGKNINVEKTDGKADYFILDPSGNRIVTEIKSIHSESRLVSTLGDHIKKGVQQLKNSDSGLSGNRGLLIIDLRDLELDNLPKVRGLPKGGDIYDRLEDLVHSKFEYELGTNQGFLHNLRLILPEKDLPEWKRVTSYRYDSKNGILSHRRLDTVDEELDY